jgi:hypothetical protein
MKSPDSPGRFIVQLLDNADFAYTADELTAYAKVRNPIAHGRSGEPSLEEKVH